MMSNHELRGYLGLSIYEFERFLEVTHPDKVEAYRELALLSSNLEQLPTKYNRPQRGRLCPPGCGGAGQRGLTPEEVRGHATGSPGPQERLRLDGPGAGRQGGTPRKINRWEGLTAPPFPWDKVARNWSTT